MTYEQVVQKAKKEMKNRTHYGNKKVAYKSFDIWEAGEEINLWTYFQGYQIRDKEKGVDILLVGQDWGNPE